jgi:hypothetical protein
MEDYEKIVDLSSEFEAELLSEVLEDKKIPFGIVSSADSAMGGIWELENGWGYIEAPLQYKDEILSIYKEITKEGQPEAE